MFLGVGLIPVIPVLFDVQASMNDSVEVLRYKLGLRNITPGQIARQLSISESTMYKNLNKILTNDICEIVKQINKAEIK